MQEICNDCQGKGATGLQSKSVLAQLADTEEKWFPRNICEPNPSRAHHSHLENEGQNRDKGADGLGQQRQGTHTMHAQWIETGSGQQPETTKSRILVTNIGCPLLLIAPYSQAPNTGGSQSPLQGKYSG